MHKKEIRELIGSVDRQGLTLVPVKMYLKEGRVKISIALARGKKLHDKRDDLRKKDDQRDMARAMKQHI
jgi:SsrA-binding protein